MVPRQLAPFHYSWMVWGLGVSLLSLRTEARALHRSYRPIMHGEPAIEGAFGLHTNNPQQRSSTPTCVCLPLMTSIYPNTCLSTPPQPHRRLVMRIHAHRVVHMCCVVARIHAHHIVHMCCVVQMCCVVRTSRALLCVAIFPHLESLMLINYLFNQRCLE